MPAKRLDGKELAKTMRAEVAVGVAARRRAGQRAPGLAAVLVGDNPASQLYVRNKQKACAEAGLASWLHNLPTDTSQAQLLELIERLNADPAVHGILIQLPLPRQIQEDAVIRAVAPAKDVDCFHPENVGLLAAGHPRYYPCTPHGILQLLLRNGIDPAGQEVVVVGRSNIVGKPLAMMLLQKRTAANPAGGDATVTVAHTRTQYLAEVCRRAAILVAAVGVARVITPDMVAPGAVVVDVGTNSIEGKLVGDVHEGVTDVASALSPVPGGVGPMTITMLLVNTLAAATTYDLTIVAKPLTMNTTDDTSTHSLTASPLAEELPLPALSILYEDPHLIAVNKPAPLLTQAPAGIPSLEAMVKAYIKVKHAKPAGVYLGIPHRLDRPVSGVLLFARNTKAAQRIHSQFQEHKVRKVYWAVVEGEVVPESGMWEDWLRKIQEEARMVRSAEGEAGAKLAMLEYRVLRRLPVGTVIELAPLTGRMHQLRVQAAWRGHPVFGDTAYGSGRPFGPVAENPRDRVIALHARSLTFAHPFTRQELTLTAPLPEYWRDLGVEMV